MSFKKEEEMYPILSSFLQSSPKFKGCRTAINQIYFNLLKGWKIDVAGVIKERNDYIITIEAKKNVGPYSVLQAISQAEMYQKISNESYIALPNNDIKRLEREDKADWDNILNICRTKGIGIISVEENGCDIINEALSISRYDTHYQEILSQLEYETTESFKGFKYEDFSYFHSKAPERRKLVRRKIALFILAIENEMLQNPRDYPNIDPRELVIELPKRAFKKDRCWFFIAEVNRKKISQYPHFTLDIDSKGISCCVNLETKKTTEHFLDKLKHDENSFIKTMEKLYQSDVSYEVKIWAQIRKGPYRPLWPREHSFTINSSNFDAHKTKFLISMIEKIKYPIVRFNAPVLTIDNKFIYSHEAVTFICNCVHELQDIYEFCK